MKEKILNLLKSNLLFSIVINAAVMIFCITITMFSYDSISDFYNSLYICQRHFYYSNEINYIYATIVGLVQFILPNFNCFVLSQILLSCTAFTTITYILCDKFNKKKSLIFTLVINILFALNHYADILSSKTAALLLAAGFMLALNAIRNKRYNLPFWIGIAEILFGSFLCFEYFFIGLAFSVAFFLGDMIAKRKYKLPFRKFFWYFRPFVLVLVFIVLLNIGAEYYSYSVNNSDSAADYYKYSEICDTINRYPFPDFNTYEEKFKEAGINTSNEYELLINGYYDSDKSLNYNALSLVAQIQKQENEYNIFTEIGNVGYDIWSHILKFDGIAYVLVFIFITAVLFVVAHKKRFAFFPLFYLIAAFLSCIYIRYSLSSSAYNMYGVWLMTLLLLVYSFDFEHFKDKSKQLMKMNIKISLGVGCAIVLVMFVSYCFVYQNNLKPESGEKPSALYTEINRHPERYYVFDPVSADDYLSKCNNFVHPLWGFSNDFLKNVDGFGYFHQKSQLFEHNLPDNIYEAVLTNNNVFVVDKYITFKKENYFNEYYVEDGKTAHYKQVKEINGFKIYEVVTE